MLPPRHSPRGHAEGRPGTPRLCALCIVWLTACSAVTQVLAEVKDLPSEPDYDTVKALEYTRALFTETLRYVAHGRLRGRVGAQ